MSDPPTDFSESAATEAALGGELLQRIDPIQLVEAVLATVRPGRVARMAGRLTAGMTTILLGRSDVAPPPKDSRFRDPTWQDNLLYHRLAQAYLLWSEEMMQLPDTHNVDWQTAERSRFVMTQITAALAPTNTLPGNPAALKRVLETGGQSLGRGFLNFVSDVATNRGLPSQVDPKGFEVGRNIAASPGAVVHREEMFEILQYAPSTETVRTVPVLLLPPPVNKYYFFDLAPGRSMIEYGVGQGLTMFTIVWRDPRPQHGGWGLQDYIEAQLRAVDVVRDIAGSDTAHIFGDCSGGLFAALMCGHLAAIDDSRIRSMTLGVTVLDFAQPSNVGMLASNRTLRSSTERAQRGEVLSADDIASSFVWMRPNDLVWKYVANNWLMGNDPPQFDVLFWNNDGQGLPSRLALDLTRISVENSTARPGGVTLFDTPIDLSRVKTDAYVVSGRTDHISPWRPCYSATRLLGGSVDFVLASSGHVQAIINPPGNPRASFHTGGPQKADPEQWLAGATKHEGSWWPHWAAWLKERSGDERPARTSLGNERHPPMDPAPGRYVLGE